MNPSLIGCSALVTGASRGIGAASARALAELGARVVLVARSTEELTRIAATLPNDALVITADLSSATGVSALVGEVRAALGDVPDIIVHAAGTFPMAPFERAEDSELEESFAVNAAAPIRLTRELISGMRSRGGGHVVTIGSVADRHIFAGNAVYAASKHAVRAMHEVLREETRGSGVRVTLISPAATDTAIWNPHDPDGSAHLPSRAEMLRAEDVADAVRWAVTRPQHVNVEELRLSRS